MIKFGKTNNKLKNEENLGTEIEDLSAAGDQNRLPQKMTAKQAIVHLKSCTEGQRILSHFLRKTIFFKLL